VDEDPYGKDTGPRPLDASLDAVSKKLGVGDSRGLGRLFAHWPEIVGTGMAEHVQPVRVDQEALVVSVDHPAWATQVRHLGQQLLDLVAERTGMARPVRVEVRVRRHGGPEILGPSDQRGTPDG
jgi:predicted nucleic acid-binding Zn ribbon protein